MSLDFIKRAIGVSPKVWTTTTATVQQQMAARLANETEVRVFVDDTPNFGNQACSVLLLNRLIDTYGFTGQGKTLTVVYPAQGAAATLNKLALLIRGLDPANPGIANYRNSGVNLAFRQIPALANQPQINYGFSGGADSDPARTGLNWFAVALKVELFLRLHPYQWNGGPHQVQYGGQRAQRQPYDLATYSALGTSFRYRGWHIPNADWAAPSAPDWAYYTGDVNIPPDQRHRAALAEALLAYLAANAGTLKLMVVYGIKASPNQMGMPSPQLLPTVVATALGISHLDPAQTPVVVVSLNSDITDADYALSLRVCQGGQTADEELQHNLVQDAQADVDALEQQLQQGGVGGDVEQQLADARQHLAGQTAHRQLLDRGQAERQNWLNQRNPQGIQFVSSRARGNQQGITVAQLNADLVALAGPATQRPAVLFFELGSLPIPVFNHLMSQASYANVFEGANTNNLALNQGNGYLRMRGGGIDGVRYPTGWFPAWTGGYSQAAVEGTNAANGVTAALRQNIFDKTDFLPNIALTTDYLDRLYLRQETLLTRYYHDTQAYFHDPANDKLLLGLSYLNQIATDIGI